jgi:hypothetical protein
VGGDQTAAPHGSEQADRSVRLEGTEAVEGERQKRRHRGPQGRYVEAQAPKQGALQRQAESDDTEKANTEGDWTIDPCHLATQCGHPRRGDCQQGHEDPAVASSDEAHDSEGRDDRDDEPSDARASGNLPGEHEPDADREAPREEGLREGVIRLGGRFDFVVMPCAHDVLLSKRVGERGETSLFLKVLFGLNPKFCFKELNSRIIS